MMRGLNSWQLNGNYLVAIQYGDVEQCAALLEAGADADQTFKINSVTRPALCLSVERGAYNLVELLLRNGVAVNRRDSKGCTSLHVAVEMGYDSIVDLLLVNRADVNAADDQLVTPLHIAAKRGALHTVSSLISYGCDINKQDDKGRTALSYACEHGRKQVIQVLLANGAFPDDLDSLGYTPLMWGLLSSNFEYDTVRLLLEHGSRLDLMTGQGNTQLQIVILSNNLEKWKCLKLLLKCGCDVNKCNKLGQSTVHLACLMSDIESLRILIQANANVNTVDRLGISPLSHCITNGFSEFAHLLIDGGATEDLNRLNPQLQRLKSSFRKDIQQRLKNPKSLMEIARKSLCSSLGPFTEDWTEKNRSELPHSLIPYILYTE
ncbi:putative ankyrin repeat protein RF_0381 isoform X2 [Folsomia candida]|uniref:Ankyrin repeat and protein kinase domain-containing protein 1 n=2 Tax=Folsomia candida TaxID=158441 RepID=A0A226EKN0_FOLCA|nr:putative ankyrin repeat protein RF_0381 isoform X2 [Folsomia candida]XP_035705695.1 putative ankyrin repeat protein RF_0381 isoform X2 [Folsomia candida]OXA57301.1 Ankyrin repeat and protein kinase domain-containing protein 1 [Folsomia candida]